MVDGNVTQAAIRAGYSKKSAQQIGDENLLKPVIAEKLEELKKAKQECTGWNMWRAVKEYEDIIKAAKDDKQYAPAVAAISKLVDLHGIEPPKKMDINHGGGVPMFIVKGASGE